MDRKDASRKSRGACSPIPLSRRTFTDSKVLLDRPPWPPALLELVCGPFHVNQAAAAAAAKQCTVKPGNNQLIPVAETSPARSTVDDYRLSSIMANLPCAPSPVCSSEQQSWRWHSRRRTPPVELENDDKNDGIREKEGCCQ